MSMSEAGDILDEATREVPEEIMDNPKVENAMQYLFDTLSVMTDWIDPESDAYGLDLYEAKHEGAYAVAEKYQSMLADALYRQRLFCEQFDLQRFIDTVSAIDVQDVING